MMWTFDKDGGFITCSDEGNYDYAYPTSQMAVEARIRTELVAKAMCANADIVADYLIASERNAYLKTKFEEAISSDRSHLL
jgi:hypothetical protein